MVCLTLPDESCLRWEVQVWVFCKSSILSLKWLFYQNPQVKFYFRQLSALHLCFFNFFFSFQSSIKSVFWNFTYTTRLFCNIFIQNDYAIEWVHYSLTTLLFWYCQLNPISYFTNDVLGFYRIVFTMKFWFLFDRKTFDSGAFFCQLNPYQYLKYPTQKMHILQESITAMFHFISLNIIIGLMYPKRETIDLQPWIK